MKKTFGIIIMTLGILLVFSPLIANLILKEKTNKAIQEAYKNIESKELHKDSKLTKDYTYNFDSISNVGIKSLLASTKEYDKNDVIGILSIPELNINLPLIEGISDTKLLSGVCTMKASQTLGEGNFAVAGHNMKNKNLLLGNLMAAQIGTKVNIYDGTTIYEYEIISTEVLPDTSLDMIEDYKVDEYGCPIISIMTCYKNSEPDKRFFAIGILKDKLFPQSL